jgi:hypothetical protein
MKYLSILCLLLTLQPGGACVARAAGATDAAPPAGYYVFQKVVYQNDGGTPNDRAYFQRLLRHLAAHLSATDGNLEIRVVNFAAGVSLFQMARSDAGLAASIDGLRARGVRFLICHNTLQARGLKPEDLYRVRPEDVVPSGVAEIARLQGLGFVYEHP